MKPLLRTTLVLTLALVTLSLSAQNYKADRLRRAVEVVGLVVPADSLLPDTTILLKAKDGNRICLRTNPMGDVEHVGIPLFKEVMRLLEPSPVYDFLEYAAMNWKYKVNPNQLYLSKVIFKLGSWNTLLDGRLSECACSIENLEEKLYVVTWRRDEKDVAVLGIPIEYELLNNDTRRNMEQQLVRELKALQVSVNRPAPTYVSEDSLSIYGTEGLFVIPGKSYIIDLLNQNVYYKLTTVYETAETVINNKPVTMNMEAVVPVVVVDPEHPAETFANLMMCDDASVPDITMELDFHMSDYRRELVTMPLSQLKAFFRQHGCNMYFACEGAQGEKVRGLMFASNLPKGYNHMFSLRIPSDQLLAAAPVVHADVYLYIPPIDKHKLFGTAPTKKSGVKFNLP